MELKRVAPGLALLLFIIAGLFGLGRPAALAYARGGADPQPARAALHQLQDTPEPAESPTPLPTLAGIQDNAPAGNTLLVGLMLVCVMGLMLAGGVFIAILIVRLRNQVR